MSETYTSSISKGNYSSLDSTPIENDKIRITLDTQQLFFETDIDGVKTRKEITDFVKGYTEVEIRSILAPLPKLYLSSDTKKILYYDTNLNDWAIVGEPAPINIADVETVRQHVLNILGLEG